MIERRRKWDDIQSCFTECRLKLEEMVQLIYQFYISTYFNEVVRSSCGRWVCDRISLTNGSNNEYFYQFIFLKKI